MKVFISHPRNETSIVKDLSNSLKKEGFSVVTPDSILPGDNAEKAIQSAIELAIQLV